MPRKTVARPPEDLLTTVTRLIRQVTVDGKFAPRRRTKLLEALQLVSNELQNEIAKRGK
jgi:hypothetical protein